MTYDFKPFDKVLVRSGEHPWRIAHFARMIQPGLYEVELGYACHKCIPYEGNEHLLGTTEMPSEKKEPKQRWRAEKGDMYYFNDTFKGSLILGCTIEEFDEIDYNRFEEGNYFQTREEAQEYAEKIKKLLTER